MNRLKNMNELDKFNVYGLYQICALNEDLFHSYSRMVQNELINLIENIFYEKKVINIPPYIINNQKYLIKNRYKY